MLFKDFLKQQKRSQVPCIQIGIIGKPGVIPALPRNRK